MPFGDKNINYKPKDISTILTKELKQTIQMISESIPLLNLAKYDFKFKNIKELQKGNIKIIEVNGAIGFDSRYTIKTLEDLTIKNVYLNLRWFLKRINIGLINTFDSELYKKNLVNRDIEIWRNILLNCKYKTKYL